MRLLGLFISPVLLAQSGISIAGRVVTPGGEPVRKAAVLLTGANRAPAQVNLSTTSSDSGDFRFEGLTAGRYSLSVEKAGFARTAYGAAGRNLGGTPLVLEDGQKLDDLVIQITPQGVITGAVTDRDGDPVQGAQVMALQRMFLRGRRQLAMTATASTDDQGKFRLAGLAPGKYYLAAERRVFGVSDAREAFALTYFPRTTDPAAAVATDVAAGNEQGGFDLRLETTSVSSIKGRALDTTVGEPPANFTLTAIAADSATGPLGFVSQRAAQTVRLATGHFELRGLPPGVYVLRGTSARDGGGALVARTEIDVRGGDVDDAIVEFGPGISLEGIVRWTGDAKPFQFGLGLAEAEGVTVNSPTSLVESAGPFKLPSVAPARYFLTVQGLPEDVYVKSIRIGNADVTHTTLDLTHVPEGLAEITLSTGAGSVAGVIVDGQDQPLGGVAVSLWPKKPEAGSTNQGVRSQTTDQSGAYRFAGLAPGDYYVAAWEEPEPGLTSSYEFLSSFSSDAAALKVNDGSALVLPLERISRDKVAEAAAKLP